MHDPTLVSRGQPLGDLQEELDRLLRRDRAAVDPIGERLPLDQLHDQKGSPRLVVRGLEAIKRRDVRVVERRQDPRLPFEAGEALGIVRDLLQQQLDRDLSPESRVAGAKDLSHAAHAECGDDFVLPELGPRL